MESVFLELIKAGKNMEEHEKILKLIEYTPPKTTIIKIKFEAFTLFKPISIKHDSLSSDFNQ